MAKPCKDCVTAGRPLTRPAPFPGPRCATDHRAFKKAQRERNHDRMVQTVYGLAPGDYERLLRFQGGRCWICRRATGKSKRMAVDHRHSDGEVRGILCSVCNRLIGHLRDDPVIAERIADYLRNPPARLVLLDPRQDVSVSSGKAE